MFYLDTLQQPPLTERFFWTYIECKKQKMYSVNQLLKIFQTSCFAIFGSSACPGSFPDM